MADRIDNLVEDVHGIKQKVHDLSERFDAVDAAIREQREYTEFAYARNDGRFDRLEAKVDQRFERVDERIERFEAKVDQRFEQVDERIGRFEAKVDQRFERVERKLDIVIDARPARRPPKRRR
jgi:chromosome segregation ATPase